MTSHCETENLFFSPSVLASERRDELTCTRYAEGVGLIGPEIKTKSCQRQPGDTPTVGFLGEGGSSTSLQGAHSHKCLSIVSSGHTLRERKGEG